MDQVRSDGSQRLQWVGRDDADRRTAELGARLRGLGSLVGNTPLLAIDLRFRGRPRTVYAKAESLNMTGSVKDRMALHILRRASETGALRAGDTIVEATSGNTGISFAALGRALGYPVKIFMPDWMSTERINLIRALGASIHMVSREEGGFVGAIQAAEEMAVGRDDVFLPRQFANVDNCEAHATGTGPEIWYQLQAHSLTPSAFVAGVGTGGTIMGVGQYLRTMAPDVRLHPVEPASSPTLSTGHRVGKHRIQGISDEFIPAIVDLDLLDEIIAVDDGDAILMAQKLARELGLGVGISAGANFLGALQAPQSERDDVVVTLLPDSNKKYLSTDLLRQEPEREEYLSPHVELLSFRGFQRVCQACVPD
jgi:cysteine synthase A